MVSLGALCLPLDLCLQLLLSLLVQNKFDYAVELAPGLWLVQHQPWRFEVPFTSFGTAPIHVLGGRLLSTLLLRLHFPRCPDLVLLGVLALR